MCMWHIQKFSIIEHLTEPLSYKISSYRIKTKLKNAIFRSLMFGVDLQDENLADKFRITR